MKRAARVVRLLVVLATAGCSDPRPLDGAAAQPDSGLDAPVDTTEGDGTPLEAGRSDALPSSVDASDASDGALDGSDAVPPPNTPTIKNVETMKDGLHVTWIPNDTMLDAVEVWRRRNANPYALAKTLGGVFDNIHDYDVTAPAFYCYRLRNVRAGVASSMSDEMCGSF